MCHVPSPPARSLAMKRQTSPTWGWKAHVPRVNVSRNGHETGGGFECLWKLFWPNVVMLPKNRGENTRCLKSPGKCIKYVVYSMNKNVFNHRIKQTLWSWRFCAIVLCWFWWNPGSGFEPVARGTINPKRNQEIQDMLNTTQVLSLRLVCLPLLLEKSLSFPLFYISKSYFCTHFWHQGHLLKKAMHVLAFKQRVSGMMKTQTNFVYPYSRPKFFFTTQPLATYFWRISKKAVPRTTLDDYVYLFELFRSRDTVYVYMYMYIHQYFVKKMMRITMIIIPPQFRL